MRRGVPVRTRSAEDDVLWRSRRRSASVAGALTIQRRPRQAARQAGRSEAVQPQSGSSPAVHDSGKAPAQAARQRGGDGERHGGGEAAASSAPAQLSESATRPGHRPWYGQRTGVPRVCSVKTSH